MFTGGKDISSSEVVQSGPAKVKLQTGEKLAYYSNTTLDRRGMGSVSFRIVGDSSHGWAEAAESWGGTVDAIVHSTQANHQFNKTFNLPKSIPVSKAHCLSPTDSRWNGVMLCTILSEDDARRAAALFEAWQPLIAILALPFSLPRRVRSKWTHGSKTSLFDLAGYGSVLDVNLTHSFVGGVTSACWRFCHYSRCGGKFTKEAVMTTPDYPRHLQTALDDTEGRNTHQRVVFEKASEEADPLGVIVVGHVSIPRQTFKAPVYDGKGRCPDIGGLAVEDRRIWVKANSVHVGKKFGGSKQVVRQVKNSELFAIWDYEGKYESKFWNTSLTRRVLNQRLCSPPGKMLRSFTYAAGEFLRPTSHEMEDPTGTLPVGKTADIPFSPLELKVATRIKAAQADDAIVDLSQWDEHIEDKTLANKMANVKAILRRFVAKWWIVHQEQLAWSWFHNQPGQNKEADRKAIMDCIRRIKGTTYWTWTRGSRLFFWKFPVEWRNDFRDGIPFLKETKPPRGFMPNMPSPSREAELSTRLKIFKLKYNYYIEESDDITLAIPRFTVPKVVAEDGTILDVRCVWDCKINGHNATVFAPGFMLPTSLCAEDQVVKWLSVTVAEYLKLGSPVTDYTQDACNFIKTTQGDIDVGQHFNNFRVHPRDQHTLGVRYIYTNNADGAVERETFLRFNCCPFGHRSSPNTCCQGQTRILEVCKGDPLDTTNEFQFARCVLNLPTALRYDPSMPRVMLLREDGELASSEVTFVDDIHVAGRAKDGEFDNTKRACKQLKSRMNSRGNQADDRKYRLPCLTPGAWNGLIIHTDTPFPMKSTTGKKWDKFKHGLQWVVDSACDGASFLETAALRRIAGLGVNITEVYTTGRCFLKGFFNAVEAWRLGRDIDGWKLADAMNELSQLDAIEADETEYRKGYPIATRITDELLDHVNALLELFASDIPLMVPLRPTDSHKHRYTVGDASAEGFAIVTQYPDMTLTGRDGLWDELFAEGGSNLREAQNFGNHLLDEVKSGNHDGCAVWAFTDNAVWSYVWNKGMSSVKHLFRIAVDLKVACQEHEVFMHMCHISGDRMIATGIDGRSRGNLDAGVSLGHDIRQFLPLDRGAFELAPREMESWCMGWMGSDFSPPLDPMGWHTTGHKPGCHVWAPPPAAALYALKQLARSRQKRPHHVAHVFLCQRLLWQEEWSKRFEKEIDVWFFLHPGIFWPHHLFEPLVVGISFPMKNREEGPWLVRQQREQVVEIGRTLSKVSKSCHLQVGDYLREFWPQPWKFPSLPGSMVR